jgi:hypothetical protein
MNLLLEPTGFERDMIEMLEEGGSVVGWESKDSGRGCGVSKGKLIFESLGKGDGYSFW